MNCCEYLHFHQGKMQRCGEPAVNKASGNMAYFCQEHLDFWLDCQDKPCRGKVLGMVFAVGSKGKIETPAYAYLEYMGWKWAVTNALFAPSGFTLTHIITGFSALNKREPWRTVKEAIAGARAHLDAIGEQMVQEGIRKIYDGPMDALEEGPDLLSRFL